MITDGTDLVTLPSPSLTPAEFAALADVPPEAEWLANIANEKTKRAYWIDVAEFIAFAGLRESAALRTVARAHVIAWRKDVEARKLSAARVRRKLSALSSLFDYLCERNAVAGNPVDGVSGRSANGNEGSTPALSDEQVRRLLAASPDNTLKGVRDRAILAALLYHGIRREEVCLLHVRDLQNRQGVMHFKVQGKGGKIRFIPANAAALRLIAGYLAKAGHAPDLDGPLFRPVRNNRTGTLEKHPDPGSVYRNIVTKYARETGLSAEVVGVCVHSTRATAATNALSHEADIAKVQDWLGHANISTTRLYDRRGSKPEESPTFSVRY